ncbi:sugar phosphate isomerase/epimerase [Panacibacter sp. DH6]|uniref:Sugar phosphate isomerase/epimerase n=1 Tax=Panacibacter microcysteis TaxID=2793269 RepID=A0A931E396_9BACT|nr:sugar phosphate isomerase/epimerase [Panacibacter microcysteis]MBG9376800.1 sugar phosphate isomerase/epimerase [Panacibacter microcysteis]
MKKTIVSLLWLAGICSACNNGEQKENTADSAATAVTADPAKDWKFGIALWTFHDVNFPAALDRVDSVGLKYIEPNTFHAAGAALKDSMIMQLSPDGIDKLKALIAQKGLTVESMYIVGDSTIQSWVKQFDIAKQFGVKFVTTEPPVKMWNSIDSLAGVYGVKVAIHEHWKGVSDYWNPDTTLMAIKDHPNFYVCADLGHWPKSGIDPLDAIKKLSGHIIGVHFKDIAAYDNPALKDVVAGTGVVKFPEIFAELKKQNFSGNIYIERDSVEPHGNVASVMQEIKYYNEQVGKLK